MNDLAINMSENNQKPIIEQLTSEQQKSVDELITKLQQGSVLEDKQENNKNLPKQEKKGEQQTP